MDSEKLIKTTAKLVFKSLIFLTSFIGILGIYNLVAGNYYEDPDLMFSVGGMYSFFENLRTEFQGTAPFENQVNQITKDCKTQECKAKYLFDYLTTFKYKEGTESNPKIILNRKSGDCDEISYLYCTLLKTADIKSRMQCNHDHCWTLIFPEKKQIYVDVVNKVWKEY